MEPESIWKETVKLPHFEELRGKVKTLQAGLLQGTVLPSPPPLSL